MTKKFFEDSKSFKEDKFFKDKKVEDKAEKDKSVLTDEALEGVAGGVTRPAPTPTPNPLDQPVARR